MKKETSWCPYTAKCDTARDSYQEPMQEALKNDDKVSYLVAFRNFEFHCKLGYKNCPGFRDLKNRDINIKDLSELKIIPDPVLAAKGIQ